MTIQGWWTLYVSWGLGLGLALLAACFWKPWNCAVSVTGSLGAAAGLWLPAHLSAAKFFSCCLIVRVSISVWARWLIWSRAVWNFLIEPDVWFWSVLQAVETHAVLCEFFSGLGTTVYIWLVWSPVQWGDPGWICCPRLHCVFWGLFLCLESR